MRLQGNEIFVSSFRSETAILLSFCFKQISNPDVLKPKHAKLLERFQPWLPYGGDNCGHVEQFAFPSASLPAEPDPAVT